MSALALQSLIGAALTDNNVRLALLNGSRQRLLQNFPLTSAQVQTLMAIRADTLEQFATEAHRLLIGGDDEPQPLPPLRRGKPAPAPVVRPEPAMVVRDGHPHRQPEPARHARELREAVGAKSTKPHHLAVAELAR